MRTATAPASPRRLRPIRERSAFTNSAICSPVSMVCAKCNPPTGSTAKIRRAAMAARRRANRPAEWIASSGRFSTSAITRWNTTSASCCRGRSPAACTPTSTKIAISTNPKFCSKGCGSICSTATATFSAFDAHRCQRRISLHRSGAGDLSGPRASAHTVLRRRRADRHGRRREARCAGRVQHLHGHQHHLGIWMPSSTTSARRSA